VTTPKRTPRERPEQPITAQVLRELLAAEVLSSRHRMPGDAELQQLAHELDGWRLIVLAERKLDARRSLQRKAVAAAKALANVLHKISELDESDAAAAVAAPERVQFALNARASASKDGCDAAESIMDWCSTGLGARGWKWLADALAAAFENAMKPANPAFRPGLSPNGPFPRFVAAVAPLITGEHPPSASVAVQLKNRRSAARRALSALRQAGDACARR
jgi:hypothetical protein